MNDDSQFLRSHSVLAGLSIRESSDVTAAEGQTLADKAMMNLKRAIAAGFNDAAAMAKNTDLDFLRNRDDFRQLSKEREAKAAATPELLPVPKAK